MYGLSSSPASSTLRVSVVCHAVGLSLVGFIVVASGFGWGDYYRWTADVAKITMAKPWDGMLSSVGMIVWSSAVAISLFAGLAGRRTTNSENVKVLIGGGVVTAVLLIDDLFMIHDEFLPEFIETPEKLATVGVAAFPLAFLLAFREAILKTSWGLLAIGIVYLGLMAVIDTVEHDVVIPAHHVWEEGAKFLGILHWCGYLILLAWDQIRSNATPVD